MGKERSGRNTPLRVLIITGAYPPVAGGVATHVYYLAESLVRLKRSGHSGSRTCNVDVVSATSHSSGAEIDTPHPGLRIHRLPSVKESIFYSKGHVPYETPVKYILDKWDYLNPDVIHSHDYESLLIGMMIKAARSVPLVFTPHRTPKEKDDTLAQRDPKNCFMRFAHLTNLIDMVIAPSRAYREAILGEGIPQDKIHLIPHGIPFYEYCRIPEKDGFIERLGIKKEDMLVLCPTRVDRHKGVDIFIEAVAKARSKNIDNIKYVITGADNGEYKQEMKRRISKLKINDVLKMGDVGGVGLKPEEMPTAYRRAAFCVLPSRREGFGQVILEAAAFCKPTIGSNTGGINEIITPGASGQLFSRDEPDDLAHHIVALAKGTVQCQKLGKEAKRIFSKNFDSKDMALKYFNLYRTLRTNSRSGRK